MQNTKLWPIVAVTIFSFTSYADMEHHRNTLIGGRAATMGGAYTAISDDASGAFYNPAGIAYATSDSFSGSANVYAITRATYKDAIDDRDWDRQASNLKPNFFGVVQKAGKDTFAFTYGLTDSFVENQDQIFRNLTGVVDPIDIYVLNLHSEDNTYLIGPSYAKQVSDTFSYGLSVFYHHRVFRRGQSQLIKFTDGDDEATYLNNIKKERGFKPKAGVMFNPGKKWSLGASLGKTMILTSLNDTQQNHKKKEDATYQFSQVKKTTRRTTPLELETGVAYFHSPYLLFSANVDYFRFDGDLEREDVVNLSLGSEYFLSEKHAIRGGLYTNHTNSRETSSSTVAPLEHIDLYGVSMGYTMYSQSTAITVGTVYSRGTGKAQIYTGSSATTNLTKSTLDFIIAADYGF